MKQFILLNLVLTFFVSCQGDVNKYNKEFVVGSIPNVTDFLTLNESEKSLDSTFKSYDKTIDSLVKIKSSLDFPKKSDFINNRGRILFTEVLNGKENIEDQYRIGKNEISTSCACAIFKDTLFISSSIGFFGGAGVSVKVYLKQFTSTFSQYINGAKPYKVNNNAEFTDNIIVDSKYQYLLLDSEPTNKDKQQLTGFLSLTSNDFFENRFGEMETKSAKVQLKFTCKTIQLSEHP